MNTTHRIKGSFANLAAAVGIFLGGVLSSEAQNPMTLQLETSTDLSRWDAVEITGAMIDGQGRLVVNGATGSEYYRLRIEPFVAPPGLEGFVKIPAGSFAMGDVFSENLSSELPVHNVTIGAFWMEKAEVSKGLWDEVAIWAVVNGYDLNMASASGYSPDHAAYNLNWFECVKWCNARSEKEGFTPCYTVGGNVYKTGEQAPVCNFAANGYRLPTEAEWEKAARGGLSAKRFPWGDTISHSEANYYANSFLYSYDVNPTLGYHPDYDHNFPAIAPVSSFAPNGYGLHDMAGNVWEWCWDWYDSSYYANSPASDPRGPSSGSNRVSRGGSCSHQSDSCRTALRNPYSPDSNIIPIGFRSVRVVEP